MDLALPLFQPQPAPEPQPPKNQGGLMPGRLAAVADMLPMPRFTTPTLLPGQPPCPFLPLSSPPHYTIYVKHVTSHVLVSSYACTKRLPTKCWSDKGSVAVGCNACMPLQIVKVACCLAMLLC